MSLLRQVEKRIEEQLQKWLGPDHAPSEGREVIEIHRAILDDVAHHVTLLPRGRKSFPFDHLHIQIAVPDPARRPVFAMALAEGNQLANDIRETLRQAGADASQDLTVQTEILPENTPDTAGRGFFIAYQQAQPDARKNSPARALPPAGPAQLTLVAGEGAPASLVLTKGRTNLGRLQDLVDDRQRIVRHNDMAFSEASDGPNATVSRAHAYIQHVSESGEYRLHDEGSAYGTAVFREGRLIPVPSRTGRGIVLRHNDEIYLGQARLRFEQAPSSV